MISSKKKSSGSACKHQLDSHKNAEMAKLNKRFKELYDQAVKNDELTTQALLHDFLYCERLVQKLYGTVVSMVVGMGSDDVSQLGLNYLIANEDDYKTSYPPSQLASLKVRAVAAGGLHSVALTNAGVPYSWGNSDDGTLGRASSAESKNHAAAPAVVKGFIPYPVRYKTVNSSERGKDPVPITEDGTITQVAAGASHILYLSLSGNVYQSGLYKDGDSGQYSDVPGGSNDSKAAKGGNTAPVHIQNLPKTKRIFSGSGFNAAILHDHSLVTWGFGNHGELARSAGMTTPNADMEYDISNTFFYKQTEDGFKPDYDMAVEHFLTPKPVLWKNPVLKRFVTEVGLGSYHILVAARDPGDGRAQLYSSGLNNYGQLGHGDEKTRHELTAVEALKDEHMASMAAGEHFSLALSLDGKRVFSFGRADRGELGIGFVDTSSTDTSSLRSLPQVVAFPEVDTTIIDIQAGEMHALALTSEHMLYTWGFNEVMATGHATPEDEDVYYPTLVDLDKGDFCKEKQTIRVHSMSAGAQHTLLCAQKYWS